MANVLEKVKNIVSTSEPTSADIQEEEIPKYGSGNIVPASDGFYDAGPGADGGSTTAPKTGSTHKGDNYDMKNVKGGEESAEALEGTTTGVGSTGASTVGVANEGRSEKSSSSEKTSSEGSSTGVSSSSGSGADVFAKDPTSASGGQSSSSGLSTSQSGGVDLSSSSSTTGGATSAEGFSGEGNEGTLRGALRGEATSTKAEYGA